MHTQASHLQSVSLTLFGLFSCAFVCCSVLLCAAVCCSALLSIQIVNLFLSRMISTSTQKRKRSTLSPILLYHIHTQKHRNMVSLCLRTHSLSHTLTIAHSHTLPQRACKRSMIIMVLVCANFILYTKWCQFRSVYSIIINCPAAWMNTLCTRILLCVRSRCI